MKHLPSRWMWAYRGYQPEDGAVNGKDVSKLVRSLVGKVTIFPQGKQTGNE